MLLVVENGMDWMYVNCLIIVQCGVLDWWKKFCDVIKLVFEELYNSVVIGKELQCFIDLNSQLDYCVKLDVELKELCESEMWQVGKIVCSLRFENQVVEV